MPTPDELYRRADTRRTEARLAYAGALTPDEAYALLQAEPAALLVDVRTRAEIDWVGRPDVPATQYAHIEWSRYPGGELNTGFIDTLRGVATTDRPLLLLCRSAVRSKAAAAAATQAAFTRAYDLLEGFEGSKDPQGHRKTVEGWCFRGLPWVGA